MYLPEILNLRIVKTLFLPFLIILLFSSFSLYADISADTLTCTQKLNKAQKVYDAGNITEVEGLLSVCVESKAGFSKEEKMQALRLMILSYLFQDENEKAEQKLLALLKEDPEYQLNPAIDPAEFYQLYNSYRTVPVLNIGILAGGNMTSGSEIKTYSIDNSNTNKPTYKSGYGFHAGITADIHLYKQFQINTGVILSFKNFTYQDSLLYGNYTYIQSKESQMWLDVPLALKYNFGKKKLRPYIYAGGSFNLLVNANADFTRTNKDRSNAADAGTEKMNDIRSSINYTALFGAGLRYKVGYGYMILDVRYTIGLRNVTDPANRFSNSDGANLFYYGYVSSDFSINNLAVSVGYLKSIYKPKKIKKKE